MEAIRKVLFPTKFEDLSFRCLERLLPLKEAGLEEVILLFVIDRDEVAYNLFRGFDKKLADQLREEARIRFEDWEKELAERGVKARHLIEIGSPEGKILEIGCREEVDLIVAGRQHEHLGDAVYLGGTTMGILRRSAIPVYVCKHPPEGACEVPGTSPFERVLYATDFSPDSERALVFVKALGPVAKAVDVVHVITERDFQKCPPEEVARAEAEAKERMAAICDDLKAAGKEADWHLLAGNTAAEILKAAQDHHSTLIVMGTKGKHGLKEMWVGSASHRVAELSPVPVVLVPTERAECYI
ncbi:universal stress protein [Deferrisoma sp.]